MHNNQMHLVKIAEYLRELWKELVQNRLNGWQFFSLEIF